jgi:hypothetical protein
VAKKLAKRIEEHAFSVEIKSEQFVKRMSFLEREVDHFFFEGFLGQLQSVILIEGLMLEIVGVNGVLRVDITQKELVTCLDKTQYLGDA